MTGLKKIYMIFCSFRLKRSGMAIFLIEKHKAWNQAEFVGAD